MSLAMSGRRILSHISVCRRLTYHSSHGISLMSRIWMGYIYTHHHSRDIKLPGEGERRVLSYVRVRENKEYVRNLFCSSLSCTLDFVSISSSTVLYGRAQYSMVQYSTVQYSTVHYSTLNHSTVQYSTVQYSTVQYSTVHRTTVKYSTLHYSTVQYSSVQYSTVQYSSVQYSTVQ